MNEEYFAGIADFRFAYPISLPLLFLERYPQAKIERGFLSLGIMSQSEYSKAADYLEYCLDKDKSQTRQ